MSLRNGLKGGSLVILKQKCQSIMATPRRVGYERSTTATVHPERQGTADKEGDFITGKWYICLVVGRAVGRYLVRVIVVKVRGKFRRRSSLAGCIRLTPP